MRCERCVLAQNIQEAKASAWESAPGVCCALRPDADFGEAFGLLSRGKCSDRLQRRPICVAIWCESDDDKVMDLGKRRL
jgi:hypothetical protein